MQLNNLTFNLNLPELSKSTSKSFDFSPKAIQVWLNALPKLDSAKTADQLIDALTFTNRIAATITQRYQLLEALAPMVGYITKQYQGRYVNVGLPLPKPNQKQAILVHTLHTEMALGYKRIVHEFIHNPTRSFSKPVLTSAIHNALYYLSQVLYVHYQTYTIMRNTLWSDLYVLYQYAEQHQCQQKPVKTTLPELKSARTSTIHDLFVKIILMVMADPYHLSQAQQQQLYDLLQQEAKPLELKPLPPNATTQPLIAIDLGQDKPPPHRTTNSHSSLIRVLDSNRLIQQLNTVLGQPTQHQAFSQQKPQHLLDFLSRPLVYWQKTQLGDNLRHAERLFNHRKVKVIIGLHDIYQYVINRSNQSSMVSGTNADSPSELPSAPPALLEITADDSPTWLTNHKDMELPTHRASLILDESAKGCRLSWGSEESAMISVGRLVAVSKERDPTTSSLLVGRTRWLKQIGSQFQVGIEWLAPCICNALLKSTHHREQQALLLSSYPHYTLITAANLFNVNDQVELTVHQDTTPIHLVTLITSTDLYAHFTYRAVGHDSAAKPNDPNNPDNIWRQL